MKWGSSMHNVVGTPAMLPLSAESQSRDQNPSDVMVVARVYSPERRDSPRMLGHVAPSSVTVRNEWICLTFDFPSRWRHAVEVGQSSRIAKMAILHSCCCWNNVRSGSLASGIYTLVSILGVTSTSVCSPKCNNEP